MSKGDKVYFICGLLWAIGFTVVSEIFALPIGIYLLCLVIGCIIIVVVVDKFIGL